MNKSFVTMEQAVCAVCTTTFDTGTILLDKRMRDRFERHTVTGVGLCPQCQTRSDDGFVAVVACDVDRSTPDPDGTIRPQNAYRTGAVAHIKQELWTTLFNVPLPRTEAGDVAPFVFADARVVDGLAALAQHGEEHNAS